jgi:regulator of sigma E protease
VLTGLNTVVVMIGAAIVVLGTLIFIHELGHFLAAKAVGIAVQRFSLGLGPPTRLGFRRGETHYCISWVPFGGYVKMAGLEDEGPAGELEGGKAATPVAPERTFDAKPLWARVLVISAGVVMNAVFAVVIYAILAGSYGVSEDPTTTVGEVRTASLPMGAAGLATLRPGDRIVRVGGDSVAGWDDIQTALLTSADQPLSIEVAGRADPILVDVPLGEQQSRVAIVQALAPWHEPVIGEVVAGKAAMRAGFRRADRIVRVGGDSIAAWERFVQVVEGSAGRALSVVVVRDGREVTLEVTPVAERVAAPGGASRLVGRIGVGLLRPVRRFAFLGAIGQGFRQAAGAAGLVLFFLKGLVMLQFSARDIGGPILVAQISGEAARLGLEPFLNFMALFSVNLAVLNLLPIPVLDGGHLFFLLIEAVRGRPLSPEQRYRFTQIGFFVLMGIMLLAVANDVARLVTR